MSIFRLKQARTAQCRERRVKQQYKHCLTEQRRTTSASPCHIATKIYELQTSTLLGSTGHLDRDSSTPSFSQKPEEEVGEKTTWLLIWLLPLNLVPQIFHSSLWLVCYVSAQTKNMLSAARRPLCWDVLTTNPLQQLVSTQGGAQSGTARPLESELKLVQLYEKS